MKAAFLICKLVLRIIMIDRQSFKNKLFKIPKVVGSHKTGAYAAQAAYFFMLSLIPIILLLTTLIQFTPVTEVDLIHAVGLLFPTSIQNFIVVLVRQVYNQSSTIIPVTILVALWSAGKGVLSVTSGLNEIYENTETRNYIFLRVRATFYTLMFILAILFSLVLSVFGNSLSGYLVERIPVLTKIINDILRFRTVIIFLVLTFFWNLVYKFLPDRTKRYKTTLKKQLPGAIFTSVCWLLISYFFSIYLDVFKGFSIMYGSLSTIILVMLWLYFCMYIILLGGELNAALEESTKEE